MELETTQDKWLLPYANKIILDPKSYRKPLLDTQYNRPEGIVLHHTVSSDLSGTADYFCDVDGPVGIHFLIGPKGEIWQLSPMNKVCTHAGVPFKSPITGKEYQNVNKQFLGIEVVNLGPLVKHADGKYYDYWHREYKGIIRHRELPRYTEYVDWVPFTIDQENSVWKLVPWLCKRWEIPVEHVIGHYEYTRQKNDPIGGFACGVAQDVREYLKTLIV